MLRFTIRDVLLATTIVALCCALGRVVGRDLLSMLVVANSSTGLAIGLWCYLTGGRQPSQ